MLFASFHCTRQQKSVLEVESCSLLIYICLCKFTDLGRHLKQQKVQMIVIEVGVSINLHTWKGGLTTFSTLVITFAPHSFFVNVCIKYFTWPFSPVQTFGAPFGKCYHHRCTAACCSSPPRLSERMIHFLFFLLAFHFRCDWQFTSLILHTLTPEKITTEIFIMTTNKLLPGKNLIS